MGEREEERAKRLAAALRENLKRRKIQARSGPDDTVSDENREPPPAADD